MSIKITKDSKIFVDKGRILLLKDSELKHTICNNCDLVGTECISDEIYVCSELSVKNFKLLAKIKST